MRWWQSSSPPSPSPSPSTNAFSLKKTNNYNRSSLFSLRGRSENRRLTRTRKLRKSNNIPSPQLLRSSSGSKLVPQPLPLPEFAVILRRDPAVALPPSTSTANVPLPSPKETPKTKCGGEERDKSDALKRDANGDAVSSTVGFGSKLATQDVRRSTENIESQACRKSTKKPNGVEKSPKNYVLNIPINVLNSAFLSPGISLRRSTGENVTSHYMSSQANQVWSAPEMLPSDMTLSYHTPNDKTAFSVDNSPLHSPRLSSALNAINPSGPPSPLPNRLSTESSIARRDSNAQTNVHPLPRPPPSAMPSQPASGPQVTTKPEISESRWKKGKFIGCGTFGRVYVASNIQTGALCALKEVELLPDDPKSSESIRQLEQEIKVLSQLKHPNIVQYYGSEIVGDRFYIYLEYVHPGSINKYIHNHCGAMTESVVRNFTRHILSGLAYLHSTKTIHRDIKGANLLVDAYGVVKLADFGMAKHLTVEAANLSLKGSPYWMAPELLQPGMQKDANPDLALAVDIWSLGCTIIEMMNGKPPWSEYEGPAAMFKVLKESPTIPETLSPEGRDFLRCCFRRNPAERPSASMLLEHQFLQNSLQLDIPSCIRSLNGMAVMDKAHPQTERSIYKLDRLPVSTGSHSRKGKGMNNESGQQCHHEISELTLGPRPTDHPITFATVPNSVKQVVRNKNFR